MSADENLTRQIKAGDTLKPWIMLGPFNHDMSSQVVGLFHNGVITFESPTIGRFVTGWDVQPTVNNVPIQLSRYPLVDSAWAHSDFGSGEMVLRYGDAVYELWFNQ